MKRIFFAMAMALSCVLGVVAQDVKEYDLSDIHIRDPFILPDEASGTYFFIITTLQSFSIEN